MYWRTARNADHALVLSGAEKRLLLRGFTGTASSCDGANAAKQITANPLLWLNSVLHLSDVVPDITTKLCRCGSAALRGSPLNATII
jgi:hypothetical protein